MPTATVTSKGQITVPKSVRDDLGLVPGSQVSFRHVADGRYELVVDRRRATDLLGSVDRRGRSLSVDEMNTAIADAARDS